MLSTSIAFLAAAATLLVISACHRPLSENERKVVGTWDRTGMDFTERTVYKPDHTFESEMSDGSGTHPFAFGTWKVEGNVLVEQATFHWSPVPNETPPPKQTIRVPILEFHPDKLVREQSRPALVRVK